MRLIEEYVSIQGEGLAIGYPTYFIRAAGCALSCSWCDTPYSWGKGHTFYEASHQDIIDKVRASRVSHICITGGEPLLQRVSVGLLSKALSRFGFDVIIETGGDQPVAPFASGGISSRVSVCVDWKLPSSGMTDKMCQGNFDRGVLGQADVVKLVIGDAKDYACAIQFLDSFPWLCTTTNVLFNTIGTYGMGAGEVDMVRGLQILTEHVLRDKLRVRVGLQLHKLLWPPMERGR